MLLTEEEPVRAAGTGRVALLQESAKRRNPAAGPNHDYRPAAIGRQAEALVRLHEHGDNSAVAAPVRQKGRANAFASAAQRFVPNDTDRKMHLVRLDFRAGGDRIETRLKFLEQAHELHRRELYLWKGDQQVNDFAAPEESSQFAVDPRCR